MAVDFVLDLEGVPGECKKEGFIGKIDMDSFSLGCNRPGAFHIGGGGAGGMASIQDISISKHHDKSSAQLMLCCLTGKHIGKGTIFCRKSTGDKQDTYIEIKLTDIIITSFSDGGSGGSDSVMEQISVNFAKIEIKYKEQNEKGALTDAGELKFDVPKGEPF